MKISQRLLWLVAIQLPFTCLAEESDDTLNDSYWEFMVLGAVAGVEIDSFNLSAAQDTLTIHNADSESQWNFGGVQVGTGYVFPLYGSSWNPWIPKILSAIEPQLNLYYLKGDVEADAMRDASQVGEQDIEYNMDLETTRLMLELAITAFSWENLSIFGIGGAGYAWNKTHYQTEDDINAETLELESHGRFGFAYQFGGGITYAFADNWALTAEYLWTQLNDIALSDNGQIADKSVAVDSDEFNATVQTALLGFRFMM